MEQAVSAARDGNVDYFQSLEPAVLQRLCTQRDEDHRTLLHTACSSGSLELVQLLCNAHSGSVASVDDEGWSPLISAVSAGSEAIAEYLIGQGADVNHLTNAGRSALHYAAGKGKIGLIRSLLRHGANVNEADKGTGMTPLHRAAAAGRTESIKVLVEEGKARIDARNEQGDTPLYEAVHDDQAPAAFLLAALGADLHAANKAGDTPLRLAGENAPALVRASVEGLGHH